jgi:hypothetical protein
MTKVRAPLSVEDLATLRDIRNDLQREGERMGMPFVQRGLDVLDKLLEGDVVAVNEGELCETSHYVAIVEVHKDTEIYQRGDVECLSCLRRMADKHQAVVAVFHARLAVFSPDEDAGDLARALCHECSEMVEVVAGKLSPHHGMSGDGCSQNDADAQIYLHPRVSDRIAELEAALVFGASGGPR